MVRIVTAVLQKFNTEYSQDTSNSFVVPSKNYVGLDVSELRVLRNVTSDVTSRQGCHDNPVALTMISEANPYTQAPSQKHTHNNLMAASAYP